MVLDPVCGQSSLKLLKLLNLDWWLLKMLEGYLVQQPTAMWNSVRGVWETTQENLLCGHLELFSETWPTSGMMRNGVVYAQPMQAHRMEGTESSLLRTPISSEADGGALHPDDAKAGGNNLKLGWQILGHFGHIQPKRNLPTPTVMDSVIGGGYSRTVTKSEPYRGLGLVTWADRAANGGLDIELLGTVTTATSGRSSEFRKGANHNPAELAEDIANGTFPAIPVNGRLPTPTTRDHKDGTIAPAKHRPEDKDTLARAMAHKGDSEWGQYEPAIRRWETVINREAPKPTEPTGRDGQQQLSAKFTEWMMGLPEGWITSPEIGLTRNEALKACGNGVVPQQATMALQYLLKGK